VIDSCRVTLFLANIGLVQLIDRRRRHGIWVPKATPKIVIGRLNSAITETLADAAVRQRLGDLGQEIPSREQQTPEALAAQHKAEIEKWWPLIKSAGLKAN
jgi:tripartite-type tricarboxylate transporter receptor subunit TctC